LRRSKKVKYSTIARELTDVKAILNWEKETIRVTSANKGGPAWRDVPIHNDFLPELKTWYEDDQKAKGQF
jgi:hypothetical protein